MSTLRAQNWLNALDVGTPNAEGWLAICPIGDSAEAEVRAELARLGHATQDRAGQVCVQRAANLAAIKGTALATYRGQAGAQLDANVPQPWDRLKDVASVEFREWVEGYLALVAAELARLEDAVAAAATESELKAIAPDWPEVS